MSPPQTPVILTRQEIKDISSEAVRETLNIIGIDPKDFRAYQADMQFLRSCRTTSNRLLTKIMVGVVGVFVVGVCGLLVMGFKAWVGGK